MGFTVKKRVLRRVLRRGSEKAVSRRCLERPLVEYAPLGVRPSCALGHVLGRMLLGASWQNDTPEHGPQYSDRGVSCFCFLRAETGQWWAELNEDQSFDPPPPTPDFLSNDFCLAPGLERKFLLKRAWSDEERLLLRFSGLPLPS